jgi:hypothetical protein
MSQSGCDYVQHEPLRLRLRPSPWPVKDPGNLGGSLEGRGELAGSLEARGRARW